MILTHFRPLTVFLGLGIPLLAGACRARTTAPEADARATLPRWEVIGHSVEGRPIELARLGDGDQVLLAVATIHGDEPAGTPLLGEFARRLAANPSWLAGHRVLVVPLLNPDGFELEQRHNARGVDLNRNFPAANRSERDAHGTEALSEPESRVLHDLLLAERPDRIVSIHQAANCIDHDGPAEELARLMAEAAGLSVRRLGARPGSLGSFAGVDLGIATVTVELPREATSLDGPSAWERYGTMLRVALSGSAPPPE